MTDEPPWEGVQNRECRGHRSTGGRAWCFADQEWCYPDAPCRGCQIVGLRKDSELVAEIRAVAKEGELQWVTSLFGATSLPKVMIPMQERATRNLVHLIELLKEDR